MSDVPEKGQGEKILVRIDGTTYRVLADRDRWKRSTKPYLRDCGREVEELALKKAKAEEANPANTVGPDDPWIAELIDLGNKLGCQIDWDTLNPDSL